MPTPISTAELEVSTVPAPNRFSRQIELFWPRLQEASRQQRLDSKYRPTILFYLGFFWMVGWTFWVIVTSLVPMFRQPLPMLAFLVGTGLLVLGWLVFANRQRRRWAKTAFGAVVVILVVLLLTFPFWASQPIGQKSSQILIGLTLFVAALLGVLSLLIVVGAFFAIYTLVGGGPTGRWSVATAIIILGLFILFQLIFSPFIYAYPLLLWAAGSGLICVLGVVAFRVPIWHVKVKYGEVFLIADEAAGPEHFRLVARQAPQVDRALVAAVVRAGAPEDRVNKFLEYGGPYFMQEELGKAVSPEGQAALYQLFTQVSDPHRQPQATLQTDSFRRVRLVWNRGDKIKINPMHIEDLITKEGISLKVEIGFSCSFDPFDIRDPGFRLRLAEWESVDATQKFFQEVLGWRAQYIAQQYFVEIPLQSALTDGSIKKFRDELVAKMAWAKDILGLTFKAEDVQCRPLVPDEVRAEEVNMMASRPRAQAETARIQALIEQVFKYNVPPKLLAGLLLVDKGLDKLLQSSSEDIIGLPVPDDVQREIYHQQKYYNQQPALPQAPTTVALPSSPTLPAASQPQPPLGGKPQSFNIGEQLTASRSRDGVYRVSPEDEDEDDTR